jgi:tubulin-specific chaperone D
MQARFLDSSDSGDLHGALWVLAELAGAYKCSAHSEQTVACVRKVFALLYVLKLSKDFNTEEQIFGYLSKLSLNIVQAYRNELVAAAACEVIANSATLEDLQITDNERPQWRPIIDFALRSSNVVLQEAVTHAMEAISKLLDCSSYVER